MVSISPISTDKAAFISPSPYPVTAEFAIFKSFGRILYISFNILIVDPKGLPSLLP